MRGSGPRGAVLAADILSAPVHRAAPCPASAARPSDGQGVGTVWRIMAERMTASWTTAPHFYLFREVNVGRLVAWRERAEKQTGARITYTDLLVKLVAAALSRHPAVNASWQDGAIVRHADINIGLAVAIDDGLIVPVIHRADTLGLAEIAARREDVVAPRARAASSGPPTSRAAASPSATSACTASTPSTRSSTRRRPRSSPSAASPTASSRVNGQPAVQPTMMLTLSCDHRALDGARGARSSATSPT